MKTIFAFAGFFFILIGCIATPAAIVYGAYEWVIVDVEFKLALWAGLKVWLSMLFCLVPGFICTVVGNS